MTAARFLLFQLTSEHPFRGNATGRAGDLTYLIAGLLCSFSRPHQMSIAKLEDGSRSELIPTTTPVDIELSTPCAFFGLIRHRYNLEISLPLSVALMRDTFRAPHHMPVHLSTVVADKWSGPFVLAGHSLSRTRSPW